MPQSSLSVQATATDRDIPKPTIWRQRSERQPTLQLLFVAPSPGPVILINHAPVTDSASMRRKRYAVLHRPTPERVSGFSDGVFAVLSQCWFSICAHLSSLPLAHFCCFCPHG